MDVKRTATTIFIVPTLKIDKNKLMDNNFINGYIKDLRKEENYENAAYLLFKPKDLDNFEDFVNGEYNRESGIIEDYDYEEGFVVLVYTLNPKYIEDFNLVKKGKYSKTSEDFQELFPKVIKVVRNHVYQDELSLQHRVFKKTEDLRDYWEDRIGKTLPAEWEVWDEFNEEKETLDMEKIKQWI